MRLSTTPLFFWHIWALVTRSTQYSCGPLAGAKRCSTARGKHPVRPEWTFAATNAFPALSPPTGSCTLLDYLMTQQAFSTASQARRAIHYGQILVLDSNSIFDPHCTYNMDCDPSLTVTSSHRIHQVTRLPNDHSYPIKVTKYVYPPSNLLSFLQKDLAVVYENDEMAVVNKPESIVTIDTSNSKGKRDDLQSLLPFILHPPSANCSMENTICLPLPVHRLDRGTSGLVIAAKTQSARRHFSALFADRHIEKTYTAVVFGRPIDLLAKGITGTTNKIDHLGDGAIIDYPIDGKPAVTSWKIVETNGTFSRLALKPKTGRYHQLRRHLAYCLGSPIVGDAKYDLVGVGNGRHGGGDPISTPAFRKSYRDQGLFLCCHKLEFDYPRDIKDAGTSSLLAEREASSGAPFSCSISEIATGVKRMKVSTELPPKMYQQFKDGIY